MPLELTSYGLQMRELSNPRLVWSCFEVIFKPVGRQAFFSHLTVALIQSRSTNTVSMHEPNGDMYYFKSRIYLARISIRDSSSKKEVPIVQLVIITARFSCLIWIYVNILVLWIRLWCPANVPHNVCASRVVNLWLGCAGSQRTLMRVCVDADSHQPSLATFVISS